ncbi:hypothetical protein MRB53_034667 [Persea americana]|uniref:Uncharacterized protein n=1 Tax=Persea americana TaxID=3435 RepID=A0ACC2K2G9_PERAE|nr:hypothetical protein MRB53_034667 [Persea americana]
MAISSSITSGHYKHDQKKPSLLPAATSSPHLHFNLWSSTHFSFFSCSSRPPSHSPNLAAIVVSFNSHHQSSLTQRLSSAPPRVSGHCQLFISMLLSQFACN